MSSFKIFKYCSSTIGTSSISGWLSTLHVRHSHYPAHFIHPIFREEEQQKLRESGEIKRYAYLPVRPARTTDTASVFFDPLVDKVINHIMNKSNKKLARSLLEQSFEIMKKVQLAKYYDAKDPEEREKIILNPWTLLHKAVENSKPFLETIPIKRGGHTYQVPVPIREVKQQALAIKWLIEAGNVKTDPHVERFPPRFAYEVLDAAHNVGQVIKRKQELHKKCEANRAYAHYRWS